MANTENTNEYIPGSAALGYSFDVMGTYSALSKLRPLFKMDYDGQQMYKGYMVPTNSQPGPVSLTDFESTFVNNRREMEDFFASAAQVSVGFGMFSAEFSASYSKTTKSDTEYQFGLIRAFNDAYVLELRHDTPDQLAEWVQNDPIYSEVPDKFTDSTRELFFRFFENYGLYYIYGVRCGCRLNYICTVEKAMNYTATEAEVKLKAEYGAVFQASGSTKWTDSMQDWASERKVRVTTIGGDNSLMGLNPGFGSDDTEMYKEWVKSAQANPVPTGFVLKEIHHIFPAAKKKAVQAASKAYLAHKLFVESKRTACLINLGGKPVIPPPAESTVPQIGFQLVAIERKGLAIPFKGSYLTQRYYADFPGLYDKALKAIQPYVNDSYIIVFVTLGMVCHFAPPKAFCDFLVNCGADLKLRQWLAGLQSNNMSSCSYFPINYALVGIPKEKGTTRAYEAYERAASCDTGEPDGTGGSYWTRPVDVAALTLDLYELESGGQLVTQLGRAR
jgi:hypothetical protein